jgi:hypothetical protein
MKGISPDEVSEYADGTLDERYPNLQWVSKREGRKKKLAELDFGARKLTIQPHLQPQPHSIRSLVMRASSHLSRRTLRCSRIVFAARW